ncbi:unnamed protein product [Mytilus edulis]|uniref:Reverse transcriptase domain-containing protein n=1 Tax=Mytilus edulis TaxID=6550 RepID=A0A8S3UJE1_MYTED|nr:unnamed protein product [Mytilus edulis]
MGKKIHSWKEEESTKSPGVLIVIALVIVLISVLFKIDASIVDKKNVQIIITVPAKHSVQIVKETIKLHRLNAQCIYRLSTRQNFAQLYKYYNMKLLFINAQSFRTAFGIHDVIEKYNIDILCLNETFETASTPVTYKDWKVYSTPRKGQARGGSAILIKPNLNFVCKRKSEYELDTIEMVCLEIQDRSNKIFNLWVPYVPPEKAVLMKSLCDAVKLSKLKNLILLGDFNAKSLEWNNVKDNSHGLILEECMTENYLICVNDGQYTRRNSQSVIDLAIISENIYNEVKDCITLTHESVKSDHIAVYLDVKSEEKIEDNQTTEEIWNLKKIDWNKWKNTTKQIFSSFEYVNREKTDDLYRRFEIEFEKCMEDTIPKIAKRKLISHRHPVWWNEEVKDFKRKLNQAQRRFKSRSTPENFQILKNAESEFQEITEKAQEEWGEHLGEKLTNARTAKDRWNAFKKMTKKTTNNIVLPFIDCDGKVLFNEQLKCEELEKTYFKGNHLKTSSFDQTHYEEIMKKYKNISEEMFDQEMEEKEYNEPIDPDELIGAIQRLKNDTAPGPDQIFSELLMKADESLYSVLSYVFNKSWEEGKLPKPWKLANVKFIRKMGKSTYNNPSSYRPISLTSILGKVMERVVTSRLEGYIETNSILDPEQEGFRHYRSTENALLSLTQNIFNAFNNNEFILAVFIDLEKAYDSVWREGLLTKLYDNGVKGNIWNWINNFLKERQARCVINNHKGSWFETKIGLPQGSVIAPLLFNIFIKDIFANLSCKKCKFADDGTVWINGKNLNDMEKQVQKDLNIIQDWTKKWRINLSIEKTEYCIFSRNGPIKKMNLQLEGKLLKYNCNPKILGVTLDEKLSFLKHIENVEQKAHKAISLLRMIKGVAKVSTKILLQIYQSIVLSTLEYASSVWQTCETNITDKLNKIQRKGLAICLNVTPTSSVETLEVVSGILPIHLRREEIATRTLAKINSYDISIPIKQILDDWKTIDIPEKYVSPVGKMILQAEDMKVCTGVDVNGIEAEFEFNGIRRYKSPPDYWKNLGNSKSRSTDQKNVGKLIIMEKLSHLPANSCIAFTDGSCLGSPGPVGAGAVIFPSNNQPQIEINSQTSIGILTLNWKSENYIKVIREIKKNMKVLKMNGIPLNFEWTPGHADIQGNDIADSLAKKGAKEAEKIEEPSEVTRQDIKRAARESVLSVAGGGQRQFNNAII